MGLYLLSIAIFLEFHFLLLNFSFIFLIILPLIFCIFLIMRLGNLFIIFLFYIFNDFLYNLFLNLIKITSFINANDWLLYIIFNWKSIVQVIFIEIFIVNFQINRIFLYYLNKISLFAFFNLINLILQNIYFLNNIIRYNILSLNVFKT